MNSPYRGPDFPAVVLFLALAVFARADLAAASIDARSLAYVPVHYSAGDEVVVQATIVPESGEKFAELDLKPGAGLPARSDVADPELRELRLSKTPKAWMLSLRFVPWSPGSGSLPEIKLKTLLIPALPYSALSLLGSDDRDPTPPRPQRTPPGMTVFLYGLGAFLLVLALLVAVITLYLAPSARRLLARRRAGQAFRSFGKSLDYLVAEADSAAPSAYFAALIRVLRLYLAARVLPEAAALTAAELAALPEAAFPAPATRDRTAALIARADGVRYGGRFLGEEKTRVLLDAATEARAIGKANEEVLRARA